jgi:hypothetical protein
MKTTVVVVAPLSFAGERRFVRQVAWSLIAACAETLHQQGALTRYVGEERNP